MDPAESKLLAEARAIAGPAAPPVRLIIPAIGVDAAVEAVGVDAQGRIAAPARTTDVGWYELGPAPGDAGDAVIDGHLDWYNGPAVFWRLADLRPGDPVTVVRSDGSQVRFLVASVAEIPYDASIASLFTTVGVPSLTLITCAGTWDQARQTYLQRLIVRTTLDPSPSNSPAEAAGSG
jgi:sortase (surface protein transpeptidase)